MFNFILCPTPFAHQAPSTPSEAVQPPVFTDINLSSSPAPGGQISQCLEEFTFTLLPCPAPLSPSPKLLDLFPNTNPSPWDDNNNGTNHYNKNISGSSIALAGERVPERFKSRWIRKRLTESDVNTSSRLLLSKEEIVKKYVLPSISQERRNECHSFDGLRVKMCDVDTRSEYKLVLKRWHSGSYVLTSNWRVHFVKRRGLKEGDIIELLWDSKNLRFFFRKLNVLS
ncbi:hypothetical protein DM860_017316 [Cuscuta australis]|uniref:TF-B3 domain-containing protein n=1 Tax=Cuscuta australis TaxID=267555 RepID=A0A328E6C6_9ASTE|nr:hypothetical protein DM860_017316 [Cuscuta australis]